MGEMVVVELDDDVVLPGRPRQPWSLTAWARLAAIVAVLVAGATLAQGWAPAPPSALGLTTDLTVPRSERWRAEATSVVGAVDGRVLVARADGSLVALDLETGAERWSREDAGDCSLADLDGAESPWFTAVLWHVSADRTRVVCRDWSSGRAAVLDPVDGTPIATVAGDPEQDVAVVRDVLVALQGGVVTARSALDGALLWELDVGEGAYGLVAATDVVRVLVGGGGDVDLDLRTGAGVDLAEQPLVLDTTVLDGVALESRWAGYSRLPTLVALDGAQRWERPGSVLRLIGRPVVDGAIPVIGESAGAVVDLATGTLVWTVPPAAFPLIGGPDVIVLIESSDGETLTYRAVGPRSGEPRWEQDLTGSWSLLTDGRRIGLPGDDGTLLVRDLGSGDQVAAWPLPTAGPVALQPLPGGAVAVLSFSTDVDQPGLPAELVVLGP